MITEGQALSDRTSLHTAAASQPWKVIIFTAAAAGFLLLLILITSQLMLLPVGNFTRDPLQVVDAPFYTGILSNIGILFWCTAASVCFFSFLVIPASDQSRFLLASGIFTAFLLADDFFLFHEVVYRNYLHIPQKLVFTFYALGLFYMLFRFKKIIQTTEYLLLYTAITFFLFSGIIDALPQNILPFHHLFEDGFKFMGITFWFVYFLRTCVLAVKRLRSPS